MRAAVFAPLVVVATLAAPAAADSQAPAARAAQLLATQIPLLENHDDAIVATFSPDAVVLVPRARGAAEPNADIVDQIRRTSPHETIKYIHAGPVTAGGDDTMVWLVTDFENKIWDAEPEQKPGWVTKRLHVVELMTAESGWKVVAAAFAEPDPPSPGTPGDAIPGATAAGPLAALLASPPALAAALAKTGPVAVLGTDADERGIGARDAHALLAKWKKLDLAIQGVPREVHGATWGFVEAAVDLRAPGAKLPMRMQAILIAVPGAEGRWTVVATCYVTI